MFAIAVRSPYQITSNRLRGGGYLRLRLIGHHVVVVRPHLCEQGLLYQTDVLSISGVVPIVDQASPHSAGFPPVIGLVEYANGMVGVRDMVIGKDILGDDAGGILDRCCSGMSKVSCLYLLSGTDQSW